MSSYRHCSSVSAAYRFEWRPSRGLRGCCVLLGVLAALAVACSDVPTVAVWPLAGIASVYGMFLSWHEGRKPTRRLCWWRDSNGLEIDGIAVMSARLYWRGPLTILNWKDADGRCHHLLWWPDTLDAAARRELRLAVGGHDISSTPPSMAP